MSSNENICHVTGPLWRESTGQRWIPLKGQWRGALILTQSFDIFFDVRLKMGDHEAHCDVTAMTLWTQ